MTRFRQGRASGWYQNTDLPILPHSSPTFHMLCTLNTHFATHQTTLLVHLYIPQPTCADKARSSTRLTAPFSRLQTHYLRRSTLSSSSDTSILLSITPSRTLYQHAAPRTRHSRCSAGLSQCRYLPHIPLIITIANLFTTEFADFNLQIELQKLDGSVDTSLPWLIRRSTSPATRILNGVKPRFSRIFTKSSPNYVDIIAQRDREIAQLRRITANQIARIELLETRNAELEKINTPPIDPNTAQQATQIAEKDTKISSLTDTTVRQAEVEVQLRKELADEKAIFEQKTRGQPTTVRGLRARAAQLSWENRVLKQEVDTLEEDVHKITVHSRNNIVNFEATKKELEKRVSSRERF